MRHLLMMLVFAASVATVFGIVGRNEPRARMRYGLKVFAEFVGIGMVLAWLLYLIP